MSEVKVNDRIMIKAEECLILKALYGRVEKIYQGMREIAYLVRLDNNELVKLLRDQFEVVQEDEKEEKPNTITITREEFKEKALDVVMKLSNKETKDIHKMIIIGLVGSMISAKLEVEIFGELV